MYAKQRLLSVPLTILLVVAVCTVLAFTPVVRVAVHISEDIASAIDPSVMRASRYGERHLNSRKAIFYDIARAEKFYREAVELDATYPYVRYQLARIEFLKGNLNTALYHINKEIELHGTNEPNAYYVRGLIEGYLGRYDDAIRDYEHYLEFDPTNWAATNDYAWVLLKAGRANDAIIATASGLQHFPENPWLLNTNATALYESGLYKEASIVARHAAEQSMFLTEEGWLQAYPGNAPTTATEGIVTLQRSIAHNRFLIDKVTSGQAR
jgi:tetratricopeptide (TPR) repeat protein